jgi:hypothetical protein
MDGYYICMLRANVGHLLVLNVFHVRSSCTSMKCLNLVHKKFVNIFDINVLQFIILQLLSLSNQRIMAIYHRACT